MMTISKAQVDASQAICRETFKSCMKATVYLITGAGLPAGDPRVSALMACAEASYSCLNFASIGGEAHLAALAQCADKCAWVLEYLEPSDEFQIADTISLVERCLVVCRGQE